MAIAGGGSGTTNQHAVFAIEVNGVELADIPDSSIDSLIDSPTNYEADSGNNGGNYATLNPLANALTLSNGNLDVSTTSASWQNARSTIGVTSGKWYWEFTSPDAALGSNPYRAIDIGVVTGDFGNLNQYVGYGSQSWAYQNYDGNQLHDSVNKGTVASWIAGDVIGFAMDLDNGTLTFYKNGTAQNTVHTDLVAGPTYFPAVSLYTNTSVSGSYNFGQRPFAHPLTGFKPLCTAELPTPAVADGSAHFEATAYSGNDGTQTISGINHSPDFVWIKVRNEANSHYLFDTVRGPDQALFTDLTSAETDYTATSPAGRMTAFTSDGFTVKYSNSSGTNANNDNYIAYTWNAGANSNKTYTVKVVSDSGNKYRFDDFSSSAVTLDLAEGSTYIFDQSHSSNAGHPIRFGTSANGTDYTTGVTHTGTPGSAGAKTTLVLGTGVGTLYYSCANHSGMGGQINTNSTAGASNFDGDVISLVKANQTAGFSIVRWTNNGNNTASSHRWGHGLLGIPDVVITKRLNTAGNWNVYSEAFVNPARDELYLDTNHAVATAGVDIYHRPSTTAGIRAGSIGVSGDQHLALVFKNIDGFSASGRYSGTGNSEGAFVHTNFRPAFLMYKNMTNTGFNWGIIDSTRGPYNYLSRTINPNNNNVESSRNANDAFDFLSNGFKVRAGGSNARNQNGAKFFYLAFAENPFSSNGGLAR